MSTVLSVALILIACACGLWDIYVIAQGKPEETVSNILHIWSIRYPILPLIIGLIIGHIFWPTETVKIIENKGP